MTRRLRYRLTLLDNECEQYGHAYESELRHALLLIGQRWAQNGAGTYRIEQVAA